MLGAMVKATPEVVKILTLEFTLPGSQPVWSSGSYEKQLEHRGAESWMIKVKEGNALETAAVLESVALAIRSAMVLEG